MKLETKFLPAERAAEEEIKLQSSEITSNSTIKEILNAVPEAVLILNVQRQIVFVNTATLQTLGLEDWQIICGLRPGEALQCDHSTETEGGCGTTEFCQYCGAANAILASQKGNTITEECRITQSDSGTALDLKVKAAPFKSNNQTYTVFSILDISDEKRKQALQRIFFHDILNTAGGLSGYSELLKDANPEETNEYKDIIYELSNRIVEEINSQRQLIAAENGELHVEKNEIRSLDILKSVVGGYRKHQVAKDKEILVESSAENIPFESDYALLSRVLGNLIKNALEATDEEGKIVVDCRLSGDQVMYTVNNQKVMPDKIKMQIFQRSFSTKGAGRGLGTYSIKLLTEKYLGGKVSFTSDEKNGTTFTLLFPV